jgi:hypothetical protein
MKWLGRIWEQIIALYWTLAPVRFSLIVVAVTAAAFWFVDQGIDILCAQAVNWDHLGRNWRHLAVFFPALTYFCLSNWYWSRFLLNCEFPEPPESKNILDPVTLNQFRLHVPRVLGVGPAVAILVGFFRAGRHANTEFDGQWWIYVASMLACAVLAMLLYLGFIQRRKWLNRPLPGVDPVSGQQSGGRRYGRHRLFYKTAAGTTDWLALGGLAMFGLPTFILWFLFTFGPVWTGSKLGSAGVLFFAFGSWACFGSAFIYLGHRWRLPILSLLALLAFLASFSNDNHAIRQLPAPSPARPTLNAGLDAWYTNMTNAYPRENPHPLYIVAAEGGGIRAGYWTALVLANLQDHNKNFANHLFAISGVSGGSLGGAAFVGLLTEPGTNAYVARVNQMLGQDFLAPLVGKMLYPDLCQRFLFWPFVFPSWDRARALEQAWEHSINPATPWNNCFTNSFTGLYQAAELNNINNTHLPALFLNGTDVENGRRIITSNLKFSENTNFLDARDGLTNGDGELSLRLSTAAHESARFTYFSPAGRFPDGSHIVDGGYFENYGAQTAHDLLDVVRQKTNWTGVQPVLIIIRNDMAKEIANARTNVTLKNASHEIFTPVTALLNARQAHAELALDELANACQADGIPCRTYDLAQGKVVLPLGWVLSEDAMTEMSTQLNTLSNNTSTTCWLLTNGISSTSLPLKP